METQTPRLDSTGDELDRSSVEMKAVRLGYHPLDRVAQDLMNQGITQIALFGAGRHTRPIVRQPWARFGISVRLIIDDQPLLASVGGIPIVQTQDVQLPGEVGAVVVSSECYQDAMYSRAVQAFGQYDVQIVKLYDQSGSVYGDQQTVDRLCGISGLSEEDANWLVENRGERHDALLPMLPPERTELHLRRYELASEILERIKGSSVADLASGTGYGATILAWDSKTQYFGVDIDARAVQYAQERYGSSRRQYLCSSAVNTPIEDAAVDVVASFETIEHIEDTNGLCQEYARVLKPDGLLVVSTPNKLGPTPFHVHDFDLESFVHSLSTHFVVTDLIGQLPSDQVFDPTLPPGMWRIDLSQPEINAASPDGQRPGYLVAVAQHRGAADHAGLGTLETDERAVMTKHGLVRFYCPGGATSWRAQTLLTKEPETLDWIDQFDAGDVYWDIGASTGPYVMYAAAAGRASRIIAFEPSPWNWWILAEQIRRAKLDDLIQAYPVAVNEGASAGTLHMRNPLAGGSGSSFGVPIGEFGETFVPEFKQGAVGISVDELVERFELPQPNQLKIDVDGREEQILRGATRTLMNPALKSVSVELDDGRAEFINRISAYMMNAGLELTQKKHGPMADGTETENIYNFIFTRVGGQR